MSVEDSYRDMFREEKRKLKQLSFGEKIVYIWDYYKIQILLLLLVLSIIGLLIHIYTRDTKDVYLYGVSINNSFNEEGKESLTNGFLEYAEADPETQMVAYDFDLTLGHEFETGELDSNVVIKIVSLMAAQQLDYMMASETVFTDYADAGKFYDLEELLPADLWAEVEDSILYFTPTFEEADRTDEYAVGINLSTLTNLPEQFEMKADPVYLGFICNTLKQEQCVELVRYLLEIGTP